MLRSLALTTLLVASAYTAVALVAEQWLRLAMGAPIVWLASSVGLAAALLRGISALPGVAAGAVLCSLLTGGSFGFAIASALVTTAQIALAWVLLERVFRIDIAIERVRDMLLLILVGATVSPLLNGLWSYVAARLRGLPDVGDDLLRMQVTSLGEAIGILLLVPVILTVAHAITTRAVPRRLNEVLLLHAATILLSVTVFGGLLAPTMNAQSLPYALFPLTFWAAFRLGVRDTAIALLVAGGTAAVCHSLGVGPFVMPHESPAEAFNHYASLYLFIAVLAITSLLAAAAQGEREGAEVKVRESEQRYRRLIERMNEGVNMTDADARLVFASDRFCEMTGYPREDLIGRTGEWLMVPESRAQWAESHRKREQGQSESHPLTMRRRDGELLHVWVSPRPEFDAAGHYLGSLNVVLDITDRRRAEDRAREHLDALAHVARVAAMGEMASAIAHEINQPLTAIATYASACLRLMKAGKLPEEEALSTMQRLAAEAERAGQIVRKMRGFARGEEGRPAPVAVEELVADVIRLTGPEARQNEVDLVTDISAQLPPILVDMIQMQQVLINLVRNAMEAMVEANTRDRRVTLTARARLPHVEIGVHDTGPGLPADRLEKIFEPFFTTKSDGIGIGLALSRSIVDAHGGRLRAADEPPGAHFYLTLPVVPESGHEQH